MSRLGTAVEVVAYFVRERRWEYLFAVLVLLLTGLIFIGVLTSPVAPLIYPLI